MVTSCEDHRLEQQLLALKRRLSEENLDPEDRRELEALVLEIEKKLNM